MAESPRRETLIGGAVVLLGVALLAATSINRHDASGQAGTYQVEAVFNRTDGIGIGSPVRLAGIPIGRIVGHTLDPQYRAIVTMSLNLPNELPDDTAAKIQTDGLLGSKYIELVSLGGGYGTIPSGGRLDYSQDSVIIEDLLVKIVAMAKIKRGLDPDIPAAEQQKAKASSGGQAVPPVDPAAVGDPDDPFGGGAVAPPRVNPFAPGPFEDDPPPPEPGVFSPNPGRDGVSEPSPAQDTRHDRRHDTRTNTLNDTAGTALGTMTLASLPAVQADVEEGR
ncbi:hypothetical protein CKO38_17105 [Rhodospirillum rubrum]|uniref:MlaD family protein n=1 Tax=Rhodospirillum rubrum TaxID=1085 RepID=UPI001906BE73|nr:MlaD family protein [Rhodospirillum rubrum]MBK1665254.1 hypothetical protein [Rhodospirillum rubrum]MBK1678356.1 hypothetical protein [Rhodospirillum rubrum]